MLAETTLLPEDSIFLHQLQKYVLRELSYESTWYLVGVDYDDGVFTLAGDKTMEIVYAEELLYLSDEEREHLNASKRSIVSTRFH